MTFRQCRMREKAYSFHPYFLHYSLRSMIAYRSKRINLIEKAIFVRIGKTRFRSFCSITFIPVSLRKPPANFNTGRKFSI